MDRVTEDWFEQQTGEQCHTMAHTENHRYIVQVSFLKVTLDLQVFVGGDRTTHT